MTSSPAYVPAAPVGEVPAQRGLGIAILVVTGLITVQAIVRGVAAAAGHPYVYVQQSGAFISFNSGNGLVLVPVLAWLLVAHWMATAARAASANGYFVKYRPWVAWWGWIIPIWNLWAPYRYMKDATQGFPVRHLGWWWAASLLGTFTLGLTTTSTDIDGVVTQTQTAASAPFNAIALTVSWLLFARIVWTVSQGSGRTSASGAAGTTPPPWVP